MQIEEKYFNKEPLRTIDKSYYFILKFYNYLNNYNFNQLKEISFKLHSFHNIFIYSKFNIFKKLSEAIYYFEFQCYLKSSKFFYEFLNQKEIENDFKLHFINNFYLSSLLSLNFYNLINNNIFDSNSQFFKLYELFITQNFNFYEYLNNFKFILDENIILEIYNKFKIYKFNNLFLNNFKPYLRINLDKFSIDINEKKEKILNYIKNNYFKFLINELSSIIIKNNIPTFLFEIIEFSNYIIKITNFLTNKIKIKVNLFNLKEKLIGHF